MSYCFTPPSRWFIFRPVTSDTIYRIFLACKIESLAWSSSGKSYLHNSQADAHPISAKPSWSVKTADEWIQENDVHFYEENILIDIPVLIIFSNICWSIIYFHGHCVAPDQEYGPSFPSIQHSGCSKENVILKRMMFTFCNMLVIPPVSTEMGNILIISRRVLLPYYRIGCIWRTRMKRRPYYRMFCI